MRHDHLMGLVWFDVNRLKAWKLEGRPSAIRAFRSSVTHVGLITKLGGA
jgi:hypothetical protein